MSWEGAHYCHVGPKKKKKTQKHTHTHTDTHTSQIKFSSVHRVQLSTSSEKIFSILGTVGSITNVRQANVKMLFSALAPCVFYLVFFKDTRHAFVLLTGWTSYNLSHDICRFFFYVTAWKPRSNLWMYPFTLFLFYFCQMLLVFNVNSGQECQIHVELISMSITDFSYSQVGLTRP